MNVRIAECVECEITFTGRFTIEDGAITYLLPAELTNQHVGHTLRFLKTGVVRWV